MARAINKNIVESIVTAIVMENDEMSTYQFTMNGNPSFNRALVEAQTRLNTKNVMVTNIEQDVTKINVDAETFWKHSFDCVSGEEYGREFVTQTFKLTYYRFKWVDKDGMHDGENEYFGVTTENKIRNHAIKACGSKNVLITSIETYESRRYMTREKYMQLASE